MKKYKLVIIGVILIVVVAFYLRWNPEKESTGRRTDKATQKTSQTTPEADSKKERLEMFRESYNRLKPLHINGKAIDSDGNPLPGVAIQISWSTAGFLIGLPYDHNRTSWVTSDKKGEWTFRIAKPDQVSIRTANKDGYVFDMLNSTRSDMAGLAERAKQEEFAAVVCMRKKKEEVLLLAHPSIRDTGELCLWTRHGQNANVSVAILAGNETRKVDYADVQVSALFDQTNHCWTLIFSAPDGLGGLLNRNELLYEVPSFGYEQEVVFKLAMKDRTENDKNYLYLKSRPQGLYTRVLYEYDSWNDDRTGPNLRVYLGTVTNPYGERSLEYPKILEEKYSFAEDEMIQEAKKAIQSGKIPKKPENLESYLEEREKVIRKAKNIPMR